jgi:1-acyl-sn-glycerol-3-phosphate acyltransferase
MRPFLFNLIFYPFSITYAAVMLPCLMTKRSTHWGIHRWTYMNLWIMRVVLGLDYRITLKAKLPVEPAIYACKHQSAWETIAFWVLVPNAIFVMKRELYAIPFIGWWIRRAGNIAIDRSAGMGAVKQLIREGKERVAEGYNIVIFPEGTRTKMGETTEYLSGVTALYKSLGVPIVPVAHNAGQFWPRNSLWKKAGVIEVVMLEAIPAGENSKEFVAHLQGKIEAECAKLSSPLEVAG